MAIKINAPAPPSLERPIEAALANDELFYVDELNDLLEAADNLQARLQQQQIPKLKRHIAAIVAEEKRALRQPAVLANTRELFWNEPSRPHPAAAFSAAVIDPQLSWQNEPDRPASGQHNIDDGTASAPAMNEDTAAAFISFGRRVFYSA